MGYRIAADLLVVVHASFVVFVVAGGLLVWRYPRLAWLHVPAALWGALIELGGWICPLTPLENRFRRAGGEAGYEGSFIDRYLVPLIYPEGLTRSWNFVLGGVVLLLNVAVYARLVAILRSRRALP